jgi:hypothetical protein
MQGFTVILQKLWQTTKSFDRYMVVESHLLKVRFVLMWKMVLVVFVCSLVSVCPSPAAPAAEALLIITLSSMAPPANGNPDLMEPRQVRGSPSYSDSIPLDRSILRLTRRSQDVEVGLNGTQGQQVLVRFTAVVLPNGFCAVANYAAFGLARPEPGRPFGAGSSIQMNTTGFSIEPGEQVRRMISAVSGSGTVIYTLEFRVLKVFGGEPRAVKHKLFEGW